MRFLPDDRGQSIQIGAVLLFAVLIILLALWQAVIVPNQNEEIEFNHNEDLQQQMTELRSTVNTMPDARSTRSVTLDLGVRYPSRSIFRNPPPVRGTVETIGGPSGPMTATIENASAVEREGNTGTYWDGDARRYGTKAIQYRPAYNRYANAPRTIYEHSVLFNEFDTEQQDLSLSDQTLVRGDRLSLITVNGSLSESRVDSSSVDFRPVSTETETVVVEPDGGPITLELPTRLSQGEWRTVFEDVQTVDASNVVVNDSAFPGNEDLGLLRVRLDETDGDGNTQTYRLRLAKVGVGAGVTDTRPAYVTQVSGDESVIERGETQSLSVQVRDEYNGPVSGVQVNLSAEGGLFANGADTVTTTTGTGGEATVQYTGTVVGTNAINVSITEGYQPVPGGDHDITTPENLTMTVDVERPPSSGPSGGSGAYNVSWVSPATDPNVTCSESPPQAKCTIDANQASFYDLTLTMETDPIADGADVIYDVSNQTVGTLSPRTGVTDSNGINSTTLTVTNNGTINTYTNSGSSGDRIEFTVINVTSNDTTAPSISNFDATNPSGTVVEVSFDSDEPLSTIDVGVTNATGYRANITSFSESANPDGSYTYTGSVDVGGTGDYTAVLNLAEDDAGNDGASGQSDTVTVTDTNSAPTASFDYSPNVPETGETVTFDASGSSDSDGTIQSYSWDFGDGSTGTGEVVDHVYSDGGTYTVTLTVTDDDGDTDSVSTDVNVTTRALFTAVGPDPDDTNDRTEFVRVQFPADEDTSSWTIETADGDVASVGSDFAGERYFAYDKDAFVQRWGINPSEVVDINTRILANSGDNLLLKDGSGTVRDEFGYNGETTSNGWDLSMNEGDVAVRKNDTNGAYIDTDSASDWRIENEVTFFGGENGPPSVTAAVVENAPLDQSDTGVTHTVTIRFNETMDTTVQPTVGLSDLVSSNTYNNSLANNGAWVNETAWQSEFTLENDSEEVVSTIEVADAQDQYGKVMTTDTSNTVTVDTISPSITPVDPQAGETVFDEQTPIEATVSDSLTGVDPSSITVTVTDSTGTIFNSAGVNSDGVSYSGDTLFINVSELSGTNAYANGDVTVNVTAADNASNSANNEYTFTVADMADQVSYVDGSGEEDGSNGRVFFELQNSGSSSVEITRLIVNSTSVSSAAIVDNDGNREFEGAGGFIDIEDGIQIGATTPTPLDQPAEIAGGQTERFRLEEFRNNGGSDRNLDGESVTITIYFADGSKITFTANNL